MATSANGSNTTANLELNQTNSAACKNLGQQDFLRLMVAQVQNPDSIHVNHESLVQFTPFNSDGVTKMQDSLEKMATSLQSNRALQASALVGRKVLVHHDILNLSHDGDVNVAIDLSEELEQVTASIYSETNELVKTIFLEDPLPGFLQFSWNGTGQNNERLEKGYYKIKVHAMHNGKKMTLKTMTTANVDSVSLGHNGGGLKLNVSGVGSISLEQVRQITV